MDNDKIECNIPAAKDLNFSSKAKNLSAVLFIYRTLSGKALKHIAALVEFAQNMLWFRGKSNPERIEDCIISENKVQDFESFLRAMGLDYHLSVKEVPGIFEQGKPRKIIFANFGKNEASLNSALSTGTESLTFFYYWSLRFKSLSFLFIDDFDAFYHYELSEKIIEILNSNTAFQSFVTTHNTSLMNNELSRPDCLFLIGDNKIKPLKDCTAKELREGHSLEKIYSEKGFNQMPPLNR